MYLAATGCVSSYRYPEAKSGPVRDVESAAWKTHELGVKVSPHTQRAAFIEAFRRYGAVAFEAEATPVRGRFVRVTVREVPNSPGEQSWGMVAAATSFILPAYSDTSGYDVSFDTFIDGQPIHHYVYEARATTWAWAGLAPAVWVNWLTPSRDDAFAGIARRFLADSATNGFVRTRDDAVRSIVRTWRSPEADGLEQEL